jgi:hypothetical protein
MLNVFLQVVQKALDARAVNLTGEVTRITSETLSALDAKANTIIFYGGKRRLRNPAQFGELVLAQTLKLAQNAHRFADRNVDTLPGRAKLLNLGSPIVMRGDGHDLKY